MTGQKIIIRYESLKLAISGVRQAMVSMDAVCTLLATAINHTLITSEHRVSVSFFFLSCLFFLLLVSRLKASQLEHRLSLHYQSKETIPEVCIGFVFDHSLNVGSRQGARVAAELLSPAHPSELICEIRLPVKFLH